MSTWGCAVAWLTVMAVFMTANGLGLLDSSGKVERAFSLAAAVGLWLLLAWVFVFGRA